MRAWGSALTSRRRDPNGPLTSEERDEVTQLRRELRTVTKERTSCEKLQPSSPGAESEL